MHAKLKAQFKKAINSHAKYYNAKHQLQLYNIEDKVFFNSKNIESTRPLKKLDYKFYRSYKVEIPINKQVYRLKLLKNMKIYNIFYVSLLKSCQKTSAGNTQPRS